MAWSANQMPCVKCHWASNSNRTITAKLTCMHEKFGSVVLMGTSLLSWLCVASVLFFYQYGFKLYFSSISFGKHIILMNDSISRLCILYKMIQGRSGISEWTTNWHQQLKTVWTFCGAWTIFLSHNFLYMNAYSSTILESQIFFFFVRKQ